MFVLIMCILCFDWGYRNFFILGFYIFFLWLKYVLVFNNFFLEIIVGLIFFEVFELLVFLVILFLVVVVCLIFKFLFFIK